MARFHGQPEPPNKVVNIINGAKKAIHLFTLKEIIAIGLATIAVIFVVLFILFFSLSGSLWRLRQNIDFRDDKILKSLARLERSDSVLRRSDSIQVARLNHIPTNPLDIQSMSKVSSVYNYRKSPTTGDTEFHAGIDYNVKKGTPVFAAASGVVMESGWTGGYGNMIKINHENGYITQYSHLDTIAVKEGERVDQGDPIAKVGRTGSATGSHLDYRITYMDKNINPVNFTYKK
jgi:murein DD-endopeptidase MepM/ murein hydrolase activator NlpD